MSEQKPERPERKGGRPVPPPGVRYRGLLGWAVFILLAIMFVVLVRRGDVRYQPVALDEFTTWYTQGKVQNLTVEGDTLRGEFTAPVDVKGPANQFVKAERFTTSVPIGSAAGDWLMPWLLENRSPGTSIRVNNQDSLLISILVPLIPWLLIFGFIWFFVFRQLRNSAGAGGMLGNFGRSRHKITSKEHTNITFDDVAGVEEAKEEVQEIVEFLKNPKKFQRLGGRIPRGVLLVGEPGTGKTLLAKAIAGEADAPFFSISGSDFVEMFVGVGASRVRDLFKQAKENSPCIIFLDEIDAVGRRRGSGFSSGGHDEREQTLNAILVEMDGFDTNDQVIVCAATNRVDVLDPALTRPGRFDRQIAVPLPDVKGRLEILKVHSRKVKLGPQVDLTRLAKATPGFSGADLAAIINEAALGATLLNKEYIEQDDLEEARDKVRWGRARKSRVIDEKEKLATAYHEAGHAVVQYLLRPETDPIHKVTVIPRGQMGGATMALPEKDRTNYSRSWCLAFMKVCFAGRIAEEMFCGDVNTGASSDIRQASGIARRMVRDWGMSDRLGFVFYGDDDSRPNMLGDFGGGRDYSEETAKVIDEEIRRIIDTLYEETRQLLAGNRDKVESLGRALVRYETLDAADVERIMHGDTLTKPTVGEVIERDKARQDRVPSSKPDADQPELGLGGGPIPSPG